MGSFGSLIIDDDENYFQCKEVFMQMKCPVRLVVVWFASNLLEKNVKLNHNISIYDTNKIQSFTFFL